MQICGVLWSSPSNRGGTRDRRHLRQPHRADVARAGPQAAFDASREAITFCKRRGITDVALQNRAAIPALLAQLGQTEQALAEADLTAGPLEATGDFAWLSLRALQVLLLVERGCSEQVRDVDRLVDAARETALSGSISYAIEARTCVLLARGEPELAHALMGEIDELSSFDSSDLGCLVRMAVALEDTPLAERLVGRIEVASALDRHAQMSAQAQLAEAGGDPEAAARLYQQAAAAWEQFGNVPERAYALLGRGRCLHALGDPAAEQPLAEARVLFASMGYKPALAETDALLAESQPAAS